MLANGQFECFTLTNEQPKNVPKLFLKNHLMSFFFCLNLNEPIIVDDFFSIEHFISEC